MIVDACNRILLGECLHRLTDSLAALDHASHFFIQIAKLGDQHLPALCRAHGAGIIPVGRSAQYSLGFLARLFEGHGAVAGDGHGPTRRGSPSARSEEHTSELQSLMRISYAV